jgi:2-methylcitrate dehydratase PrpD
MEEIMAASNEPADTRPDFAADFAAFSSALTLARMPTPVVEAVKADIFDTLACATAGISANGVSSLLTLVANWGGKSEAAIWCTGLRVPAHHAAWVNGMMSHARDFDDTHDAAVLHAGVSVVPAAIAAAELNPASTGEDLLCGVAAGLELICRLGVATKVGIIESGYMYTSLFGHFAATAAAARVLRLNTEQTVNALGIAYSQAAGTHQVTRDAALTKRIQPGFAAKTGLISVAMTQAGIRGAQRTFEGVDGLFRSYLHGRYDRERLREGLGERFDLVDLSFKPYPCCRFNHTAIDAALSIREQMGPGVQIRRITANVNRQSHEAVGTPIDMRRRPETVVQAQFSIPYTVACALQKGTVKLADFTDEGICNREVRAIAALTDVVTDPEIERDWSRNVSPTRLVVETDRGVFEARVDHPRGNFGTPMTREDFDAKMQGCLEISGIDWPSNLVVHLRAAVDGLTAGTDVRTITNCLTTRKRAENTVEGLTHM